MVASENTNTHNRHRFTMPSVMRHAYILLKHVKFLEKNGTRRSSQQVVGIFSVSHKMAGGV